MTTAEEKSPVTIIIGGWYSKCSACGKNAAPEEKTHENKTMTGPGCGARYTHVRSGMVRPDAEKRMREMRPDLIYEGP